MKKQYKSRRKIKEIDLNQIDIEELIKFQLNDTDNEIISEDEYKARYLGDSYNNSKSNKTSIMELSRKIINKKKLSEQTIKQSPFKKIPSLAFLLPKKFADAFSGDVAEIVEARRAAGDSHIKIMLWLATEIVRSAWPIIWWRLRQATEVFLKFIGLAKAVEWLVGKF